MADSLKEFLREEKLISRFVILRAGLIGMMAGALFGIIFSIAASII